MSSKVITHLVLAGYLDGTIDLTTEYSVPCFSLTEAEEIKSKIEETESYGRQRTWVMIVSVV
jgi:hypothetical protein